MELRIATPEDKQAVFGISLRFYDNSPYNSIPVDIEKIDRTIDVLLAGPANEKIVFLLIEDELAVGILASVVCEILFSHAKIAMEQMWWVDHGHRTRQSFKLLDAFEYWAENIAKAHFAQLCTLSDEGLSALTRIYEKRGFKLLERAFLKELN